MRIKMKSLKAGPDGVLLEGQVYSSPQDLTEEEARNLVDGGYAEEVKAQAVETIAAPVEAVEQAVRPRPATRPRGRISAKADQTTDEEASAKE